MSARARSAPPARGWAGASELSNGLRVVVEESHELPIVDVELVFRAGAAHDPPERAGLARIAARMLRMGTRELSASETDDAIDGLGATLSVDVGHGTTRIRGAVIRRNLAPFLELLGALVSRPALRADDLARSVRETVAELDALRDNDRWLASRAFRAHLFGEHLYGRSTAGDATTLARVRRKDVAQHIGARLLANDAVLGIAGDVIPDELVPMLERAFARLARGAPEPVELAVPALARGRRVLVVSKPERTQTQLYIGTLGTRLGDPLFYPLLVANTAFGGTFTSRLSQAVRAERGWSYTTQSRFGADRQREAFTIYSHPAPENVVACVELELELLDALLEAGITEAELRFCRDYLVRSHAFDRDTSSKRLEPRLEAEVHAIDPAFFRDYLEHVRSVTSTRVREALRARVSGDDLSIVVLATPEPDLVSKLAAIRGVREVDVVDFASL